MANQTLKVALIGAVGGFALSLLKMIDAGFFISVTGRPAVITAYLTYAAFILLGAIAAAFLADFELPYAKLRRLAFTIGIASPSVLIALAQQPVKLDSNGSPTQSEPPIRTLMLDLLPLSSAIAADAPPPAIKAQSPEGVTTNVGNVTTLKRSDLAAGIEDGFRAAIGRGQIETPYAYVLGATTDIQKANSTANSVRSFLMNSAGSSITTLSPRVVKIEGQEKYFVVVGEMGDRQSVGRLRSQTKSVALEALAKSSAASSTGNSDAARIAELIGSGPVVPASELAK
jgi:hypothetical protein